MHVDVKLSRCFGLVGAFKFVLIALLSLPALAESRAKSVVISDFGVETTFRNPTPIVSFSVRAPGKDGNYTPPATSNFWASKSAVDERGIPHFVSEAGERFYNVAIVAFAAINSSSAYPELDMEKIARSRSTLSKSQLAAFAWLEQHKYALSDRAITWKYDFDLSYNNMSVKAGWPSAFSQAAIIQAYLSAFDVTMQPTYLDRAHEAARAYLVSVDMGGLTSEIGGRLAFFEEVPLPGGYSPHVLNGHLYSLFAIEELLLRREDAELAHLAKRAHETIERLIPSFDQGYWTRYDLKPRFVDVPFVFEPLGAGTVVRSISLKAPDGTLSRLDLAESSSKIGRNLVYGSGWQPTNGGQIIAGQDAFGQFVLPVPANGQALLGSYTLNLQLAEGSQAPNARILGFRQGVWEYFPLKFLGERWEGGQTIATYELSDRDLQWSDLQRYYVDWHQRLMTALQKYKSSPVYAVTAYRWQNYLKSHAQTLKRQLSATGSFIMSGDRWAVGDETRTLVEARKPLMNRRIAAITDDPELDAQIVKRLGNEPVAALSRQNVVERLIRGESAGKPRPLELVEKLRRLGIETRLYELTNPVAGASTHFIEVDIDDKPAAYDIDGGISFQLGVSPASLGMVLASFAADRPPVPDVAGQVARQPDQLTIRPLSGAISDYRLPIPKSPSRNS